MNDDVTFIETLREKVETAIRNALVKHGVADAEKRAKAETQAVILFLLYQFRGAQLYIPLKCDLLSEAIYEEMTNGATANELASKYGIAYSTVYKYFKAEQAKQKQPKQVSLFEEGKE